VVKYEILPSEGRWRKQHLGEWSLTVINDEVFDLNGNSVDGGEVDLTRLELGKEPKLVTVNKTAVRKRREHLIIVTLTGPIAAVPSDAFNLENAAGEPVSIDSANLELSKSKRAITISFAHLPDGQLPAGTYNLSIAGSGLRDVFGRLPDLNEDGEPGGTFSKVIEI
jgi:hypothetical protein